MVPVRFFHAVTCAGLGGVVGYLHHFAVIADKHLLAIHHFDVGSIFFNLDAKPVTVLDSLIAL